MKNGYKITMVLIMCASLFLGGCFNMNSKEGNTEESGENKTGKKTTMKKKTLSRFKIMTERVIH